MPLKLTSFLEKDGERIIENLENRWGHKLIHHPLNTKSSSNNLPGLNKCEQTPSPASVGQVKLMENLVWTWENLGSPGFGALQLSFLPCSSYNCLWQHYFWLGHLFLVAREVVTCFGLVLYNPQCSNVTMMTTLWYSSIGGGVGVYLWWGKQQGRHLNPCPQDDAAQDKVFYQPDVIILLLALW